MRVVCDFWEEHCVECGAPACYSTCENYQRGEGGLCRRIADGKFLPWGKLELFWQGRLCNKATKRILGFMMNMLRPAFMCVGKGFLFRGLRRRLTRRIGRYGQPTDWIISCRAENGEDLLATIANDKKEDILIKRLSLQPGENHFVIPLPKLPCGVFFSLSSMDGTKGRVVFEKNEIMCADNAAAKDDFVKCVVWDLDNTLWSGTFLNDGDSIVLREDVVEVIKVLDSRGIVSSICSKNEYAEVWPLIERFGLAEYFVFPRINWSPKSENIRKIAKDINIGLNALAFVDDSAHERGEVHENLPMIRIFDENRIKDILDRKEFNPPTSTESASRRLSYLAEMRRRKDESEDPGNHEDFIRQCYIELTCIKPETEEIRKRCWELVNRTNQLTLAAHRYTEQEFNNLLREAQCWAIKCHDKYGDYGVVGFIAIAGSFVKEFVMSCRVAKKYCEQSVIFAFAKQMKARGDEELTAQLVATGRNTALIEAFDEMPFTKYVEDGVLRYRLDLTVPLKAIYSNRVVLCE